MNIQVNVGSSGSVNRARVDAIIAQQTKKGKGKKTSESRPEGAAAAQAEARVTRGSRQDTITTEILARVRRQRFKPDPGTTADQVVQTILWIDETHPDLYLPYETVILAVFLMQGWDTFVPAQKAKARRSVTASLAAVHNRLWAHQWGLHFKSPFLRIVKTREDWISHIESKRLLQFQKASASWEMAHNVGGTLPTATQPLTPEQQERVNSISANFPAALTASAAVGTMTIPALPSMTGQ